MGGINFVNREIKKDGRKNTWKNGKKMKAGWKERRKEKEMKTEGGSMQG